jgi:DNA-binding LytR/AlgR family response regulator
MYNCKTAMKNLVIIDEFRKQELFFIARLPIVTGTKEVLLLKLPELNFIEADGSYSRIYSINNKKPYHTSKNIGYYEKVLPAHSFLRIHSKFIVNLNQIQYIKSDNHWCVELMDKSIIKVSDDKRAELLKKLGLKPDSLNNTNET